MISAEFAIPVMVGRMSPEQIEGLGVNAKLLLYVAGTANAQRRTFYLTLREFAVWAGCSYTAARNAMDWMEKTGLVHEVERRGKDGIKGKLGDVFREVGLETGVVVKVYSRVFDVRPERDDRRLMQDAVGSRAADVRLWGLVCETWKRERCDPMNIGGLVDRFMKTRAGARSVLSGAGVRGSEGDGEPDYKPREV